MNNEKPFTVNILAIFSARNIVFMAMLAVGSLCILMSARNTASYLLFAGMDTVIAYMTGIALIIFSATSFTATQLFLIQKGAVKLFSVLFVAVGITVITFSIFSTLSLNYAKFLNSDAIQADLREKIDKKKSEILATDRENSDENVNLWAMKSIDRLLSLGEQSGESWNSSMKTIMETTQGLSSTERAAAESLMESVYVETLPNTFFGFMLGLRTLETKYSFDFFMIAIPAVFYDLIAPLAMTVVLFLMGLKNKEPKPEVQKVVIGEHSPLREKEKPKPDLKELTVYIDSALQDDFSLLPDEAIGNIEEKESKRFREYLMTFIYKDNPIITEKEGRFVSIFDRSNLKRFIELQHNVKRMEGG